MTVVRAQGNGRTKRRRVPRSLIKVLSPLALVGFWQLASSEGWLSDNTLASPSRVVAKAGELLDSGELQSAIVASAGRVGLGLLFGLSAAVVFAVVSGLFRWGEDIVDAPIQMLRTIPVVGLIPLLIIWFGIGEEPKIILISLGVFFPLYLNLFAGIRGTDPGLVEAGRTVGLSRWGQTVHVILPAAMPSALVGLRYSIGVSWLILVFAETINATSGIGFLINQARDFYETDTIVLCLVLYAVLGLLADLLVRLLERVLLSWRPTFATR
ncbi:ABC transporter permease [Nakamurella sp. UYEF19]|uniref:ABC transporter permease n=1 Tax=Nakamurella sp. UYEF19 TaxID=1756392 RepID=UPI003395131C